MPHSTLLYINHGSSQRLSLDLQKALSLKKKSSKQLFLSVVVLLNSKACSKMLTSDLSLVSTIFPITLLRYSSAFFLIVSTTLHLHTPPLRCHSRHNPLHLPILWSTTRKRPNCSPLWYQHASHLTHNVYFPTALHFVHIFLPEHTKFISSHLI